MLVSQILQAKGRAVIAAPAKASLAEAARLLARHKVGAVLILDAAGGAAGILSERDIVRAVASGGPEALSNSIESSMTNTVVTCAETDTVEELMECMTHSRVRHLPVVAGGRVVGIVSIGDVVKTRIEETVSEANALKNYIAAG